MWVVWNWVFADEKLRQYTKLGWTVNPVTNTFITWGKMKAESGGIEPQAEDNY